MNWEDILDMAYNGKTGIEFSWNMTLRAFIQWLLDQEIWKFAVIIGAIIVIILLYKIWETTDKDEPKNKESNNHIIFNFDNEGKKL